MLIHDFTPCYLNLDSHRPWASYSDSFDVNFHYLDIHHIIEIVF
jgi:hypothetical protein